MVKISIEIEIDGKKFYIKNTLTPNVYYLSEDKKTWQEFYSNGLPNFINSLKKIVSSN